MLPFELPWVKKEWCCHLSSLEWGKTDVSIQGQSSEGGVVLPFELTWVGKTVVSIQTHLIEGGVILPLSSYKLKGGGDVSVRVHLSKGWVMLSI